MTTVMASFAGFLLLLIVTIVSAFVPHNTWKCKIFSHALIFSRPLPSKFRKICRPASAVNWRAESTIESLIEKVKNTAPQSKIPDKIFKSIKKPNGAPTVCSVATLCNSERDSCMQVSVEFSRTPGSPRQKVESISLAFRRNKAAVIVVDTQYPYEGGDKVTFCPA